MRENRDRDARVSRAAVFRVRSASGEKFAVKIEYKDQNEDVHLKMEIAVLKRIWEKKPNTTHFPKMIDRGGRARNRNARHTRVAVAGKRETFYFIVMELVGPSLRDLLRKLKVCRCSATCDVDAFEVFTQPCAFGVMRQCLKACEELHEIGCVHRDIKPANYAIGAENHRAVSVTVILIRNLTHREIYRNRRFICSTLALRASSSRRTASCARRAIERPSRYAVVNESIRAER